MNAALAKGKGFRRYQPADTVVGERRSFASRRGRQILAAFGLPSIESIARDTIGGVVLLFVQSPYASSAPR